MGELGAIFRSRIKWRYSSCRILHTARIIIFLDDIERWEKEALEQGLGNSFKPKKKKQKQKGNQKGKSE
ncbi:hypothetical protein VN1248_11810 [Helicobacter pylori]|nr:hypothetical protein VN1248_11810 [Helicobacter pylori]GHS47675.1 hypothetical protein VN1165_13990 [Helicobacter pylori]